MAGPDLTLPLDDQGVHATAPAYSLLSVQGVAVVRAAVLDWPELLPPLRLMSAFRINSALENVLLWDTAVMGVKGIFATIWDLLSANRSSRGAINKHVFQLTLDSLPQWSGQRLIMHEDQNPLVSMMVALRDIYLAHRAPPPDAPAAALAGSMRALFEDSELQQQEFTTRAITLLCNEMVKIERTAEFNAALLLGDVPVVLPLAFPAHDGAANPSNLHRLVSLIGRGYWNEAEAMLRLCWKDVPWTEKSTRSQRLDRLLDDALIHVFGLTTLRMLEAGGPSVRVLSDRAEFHLRVINPHAAAFSFIAKKVNLDEATEKFREEKKPEKKEEETDKAFDKRLRVYNNTKNTLFDEHWRVPSSAKHLETHTLRQHQKEDQCGLLVYASGTRQFGVVRVSSLHTSSSAPLEWILTLACCCFLLAVSHGSGKEEQRCSIRQHGAGQRRGTTRCYQEQEG